MRQVVATRQWGGRQAHRRQATAERPQLVCQGQDATGKGAAGLQRGLSTRTRHNRMPGQELGVAVARSRGGPTELTRWALQVPGTSEKGRGWDENQRPLRSKQALV